MLDNDFELYIRENLEEDGSLYEIYCKECTSCGVEGCCSALSCNPSSPNCLYPKTYINDLKFGYEMYHELMKIIDDDPKYEKQINELLEKMFRKYYYNKHE